MASIRRARCSRLSRPNVDAVGARRRAPTSSDSSTETDPMNAQAQVLRPAAELARVNPVRIPSESAEYRAARAALLAEEIELRRHIERVAAQRRALPPGGPVIGDYRFEGENGTTDFAGLFGNKQTLVVYGYMFGPQ